MTENFPVHEMEYRVPYADTDRMGIVYYANYLIFFEKGRTELMRKLGLRYRDLENNDKVFLPCTEANVKYHSPAYYDDLLTIRTKVQKLGSASINFEYQVTNAETRKTIVAGATRHPFINRDWKPVRVPDWVRKKLNIK